MVYDNNNGGEYGKYFVQNSPGPAMDAEFKAIYDQFAKRILSRRNTYFCKTAPLKRQPKA